MPSAQNMLTGSKRQIRARGHQKRQVCGAGSKVCGAGIKESQRTSAREAAREAAEAEAVASSPPRKKSSAFARASALRTRISYLAQSRVNPDESTQDFMAHMDRSRESKALASHDLWARCLQAEADRDRFRAELLVTLEELDKAERDLLLWRSAGTDFPNSL
ncbi:hypothetical protein B0H11DRAFT_1903767 [Mycena galericulata]|nr:hypothetical protein B0H11DRAFT_1903767 [Mycena galericulata]